MRETILICLLSGILFAEGSSQNRDNHIDSGYIDVDGGKLYYEMAGNGENIVLLHDGMVSNEIWDYQYLQQGKVKEAVCLFTLNTISYPDSWNVYDSLGEGLLKDGHTDQAIKNYEKSLELNPEK